MSLKKDKTILPPITEEEKDQLDAKLTEAEQELRQVFRDAVRGCGITLQSVADSCGRSAQSLDQWLNNRTKRITLHTLATYTVKLPINAKIRIVEKMVSLLSMGNVGGIIPLGNGLAINLLMTSSEHREKLAETCYLLLTQKECNPVIDFGYTQIDLSKLSRGIVQNILTAAIQSTNLKEDLQEITQN